MQIIRMMTVSSKFWLAAVCLALGCLLTVPNVEAQCTTTSQGFNTIYGQCINNGGKQGSFAFVDASQFTGTDICMQIQNSFGKATGNYGVVVDARSINPTMPCSVNPWAPYTTGSPPTPAASVVLLPSGTITLNTMWVMPAFARIVGQGPGSTTLKANFSSGDMIHMGDTGFSNCPKVGTLGGHDCPGVEIEHLTIDGNSQPVNGIVDMYGEELSYVDDVVFQNIAGTALSVISPYSFNSGPFTNLTMSAVGVCLNINAPAGGSSPLVTRGVHGLTCNTTASSNKAAIFVDGGNNTLEDIVLNGSNTNGILIGDHSSAQDNLLFNISGSGFTNLITISNQTRSSGPANCPAQAGGGSSSYYACDITIMGVTNGSGTTVNDQINGIQIMDANLGMYILGEPVQFGTSNDTFLGYSHFTTSLKWPTWLVGTTQANQMTCPSVGSLYSVTSAAAPPTLLECESSGSSLTWMAVK